MQPPLVHLERLHYPLGRRLVEQEALSIFGWVMLAAVVSMVTNIGVNYVLIFGKFGMPALGAIGFTAAGIGGIWVLISILRSK